MVLEVESTEKVMDATFHVPKLGSIARVADALVLPIMRLPIITHPGESPQLTHFWNNIRVPRSSTDHLDTRWMVKCKGDKNAQRRQYRLDVRFHLGGWCQYVVLKPFDTYDQWYVGWITPNSAGVSRIPITERVRMLIGPDDVQFFGVRRWDNKQIILGHVGNGKLGNGSDFKQLPLH